MARRNRAMALTYADDLRLFATPARRIGLVALGVAYLVLPRFVLDDFWANVLALAGVTAIGALGLNLLTGYTGQVSLGHAAFIGLGAFTGSYLGRSADLGGKELPLLVYLLAALLLGGLVGFVVGLPALRLRGNYLVIVTLGLIFIALYVWKKWTTVTGGNAGTSMPVTARIGHFDFLDLTVLGEPLGAKRSLFYLVWALVALVALVVKNIVRSRPGRALQAVRDRDVAAEVIGVSIFRSKVGAFVVSSAIASLAGALYGLYLGYLTPSEDALGLALSIQFLAIIVVGGIGTIYGVVIGAVLVGSMPALIDRFADSIPFVTTSPSEAGISKGALEAGLYALLIIVFLVVEPRGIAGIWQRIRSYFRSWPFSH
jgi:branched-chain amino acid transport system permease protein